MNQKNFTARNQLQVEAELSQSAITKLIALEAPGSKWAASTLFALADALDVNPEWLYRGTGPERLSSAPPKTVLEKAAAMARLVGIKHETIEKGLEHYREHDLEGDADVFRVLDAIRLEHEKARQRSSVDAETRRTERARFKANKKKRIPKSERTAAPKSSRAKPTGST